MPAYTFSFLIFPRQRRNFFFCGIKNFSVVRKTYCHAQPAGVEPLLTLFLTIIILILVHLLLAGLYMLLLHILLALDIVTRVYLLDLVVLDVMCTGNYWVTLHLLHMQLLDLTLRNLHLLHLLLLLRYNRLHLNLLLLHVNSMMIGYLMRGLPLLRRHLRRNLLLTLDRRSHCSSVRTRLARAPSGFICLHQPAVLLLLVRRSLFVPFPLFRFAVRPGVSQLFRDIANPVVRVQRAQLVSVVRAEQKEGRLRAFRSVRVLLSLLLLSTFSGLSGRPVLHLFLPAQLVACRHLFERSLVGDVHHFPATGALLGELGEDDRFSGVGLLVLLATGLHEERVGGHFAARLAGLAPHSRFGRQLAVKLPVHFPWNCAVSAL